MNRGFLLLGVEKNAFNDCKKSYSDVNVQLGLLRLSVKTWQENRSRSIKRDRFI